MLNLLHFPKWSSWMFYSLVSMGLFQQNQRYNISEDTWRQVLVFSRCVHEDLAGYDLEGRVLLFSDILLVYNVLKCYIVF